MIKVLYAALYHDPRNPDAGSGTDYNIYQSFLRAGYQVEILGPFSPSPQNIFEQGIKRIYKHFSKKSYLKWDLTYSFQTAFALNNAIKQTRPDVVFTIFPPLLIMYNSNVPCVFRTDTSFVSMQKFNSTYGSTPLKVLNWMEGKAVKHSQRIIVTSTWAAKELSKNHQVDLGKIEIIPAPAAIPYVDLVKIKKTPPYFTNSTIHLLMVARDFYGKGGDIAIETVKLLNNSGINSNLIICGCKGEDQQCVKFVGPFRKSTPVELESYLSFYQSSDILIHPSRYDGAAIVPAEAAAFGVPTITNNVGGMGTSVLDGINGYVLPTGSPASLYANKIQYLVENPGIYAKLSQNARDRYESEQNWISAGEKISKILLDVIQ